MSIEKQYLSAISNFFSPVVLDSIATKGYSSYLQEVVINSSLQNQIDLSIPLHQFFDFVYSILFKQYRNEYVYKNVLAKKLIQSRHSLKTSQMLSEFRVGECKADVVIINGTSTAYEIKSDFDSFKRLNKQLATYSQVFDEIFVITSEVQAKKLKPILPPHVGLLVLTDKETISTNRKAESNKQNIKLEVLFDSLRKPEYSKVIESFYGELPDVPNTQLFRKCKKLYCMIPKDKAFDLTNKILKKRNNLTISTVKSFTDQTSKSLSAYAINNSNQSSKLSSLLSYLTMATSYFLKPFGYERSIKCSTLI